jgi:hypothetical protein
MTHRSSVRSGDHLAGGGAVLRDRSFFICEWKCHSEFPRKAIFRRPASMEDNERAFEVTP